ncbi:MAG: hypothetical protein ACLSAO_02745 [Anaerovoracaceae bacterium]
MYIRPLVKQILTILTAVILHLSVSNIVSTTPDEAAESFLKGIKSQNEQVMEKYMDSAYINFVCNVQGDKDVVKRMKDALFRNFSYDIIEVGEKNDVAVAKVAVKCNDFSSVKADYDAASYKYITDNLYSDDIGDKDALNAECLDIYVQQIEKAANREASLETVVYIPMADDGYYGWNLLLSDEVMKILLGGLEIPGQQ